MCKHHGDSPLMVNEIGETYVCIEAALELMTPEAKAWIAQRPKACAACGRELTAAWEQLMIAATYLPAAGFHAAMGMLCECAERALHDERRSGDRIAS